MRLREFLDEGAEQTALAGAWTARHLNEEIDEAENAVERVLLLLERCRLEHFPLRREEAFRDSPAQMFLTLEIMEEAPFCQPRRLAHLIDRGGSVAFGQHQFLRGVEQLLLGRRIRVGFSHVEYLPVGIRIPSRIHLSSPF